MKLVNLTTEEIIQYSISYKSESNDLDFFDAVIRFMEYNAWDIGKRLSDVFGDDAALIAHCLIRYILIRLENEKFDLRLYNAVIKCNPKNISKDFILKHKIIKKKITQLKLNCKLN